MFDSAPAAMTSNISISGLFGHVSKRGESQHQTHPIVLTINVLNPPHRLRITNGSKIKLSRLQISVTENDLLIIF